MNEGIGEKFISLFIDGYPQKEGNQKETDMKKFFMIILWIIVVVGLLWSLVEIYKLHTTDFVGEATTSGCCCQGPCLYKEGF